MISGRFLHPLGRVHVVADDAGDVPIFGRFRRGAVGGFPFMSRRYHWQPVALVPARPAAEVRQLDHHRRPGLVAVIDQTLHPRHDLVLPDEEIREHRRAVPADAGRSRRHHHRHPGPCALQVIQPVPVLRHPVVAVGGFVAGRHDPVAQRQVLQLKRLKKRIVRHGQTLCSRGNRRLERVLQNLTHVSSFVFNLLVSASAR
jgi:hypothetical protein